VTDVRCARTCLVQNAQVYGGAVVFWLSADSGTWLVVVQPGGRIWRTREDFVDSFTVLPGADPAATARVVVENGRNSHEVLDLRDGRVLATGLAIPGIRTGAVGSTVDGHPVWYRLSGDYEVLLVDVDTLKQVGPAIPTGTGDVIGTADGRLLVGPTGQFSSPVRALI
jgi:hypothetical protein